NRSLKQQKRMNVENRKILLYDDATKEDWDEYRNKLDKLIKNDINSKKKKEGPNYLNMEERINEKWDKIVQLIQTAVNKTIPYKQIKGTQNEKRKQVVWNPRYKWIKKLRKLDRKAQQNLKRAIDTKALDPNPRKENGSRTENSKR
ncbi:14293_t:CDS:2, partial [Gigaspora rosea]